MVRHRQANDQTDRQMVRQRQADGQTQTDETVRHRQMSSQTHTHTHRWSDTDRQLVRHRHRDSRTDQGICEETEGPLGAKTVHMTGQSLCYHADVGCQFLFINSLSGKHK